MCCNPILKKAWTCHPVLFCSLFVIDITNVDSASKKPDTQLGSSWLGGIVYPSERFKFLFIPLNLFHKLGRRGR